MVNTCGETGLCTPCMEAHPPWRVCTPGGEARHPPIGGRRSHTLHGGCASARGVQRSISPQVLTKESRPPSSRRHCTVSLFLGLTNTCCNRNGPTFISSGSRRHHNHPLPLFLSPLFVNSCKPNILSLLSYLFRSFTSKSLPSPYLLPFSRINQSHQSVSFLSDTGIPSPIYRS